MSIRKGGIGSRLERTFPHDSSWAIAIDAYLDDFAKRGVSPRSVEIRRYQLKRISREVGKRVDLVTERDLLDVFERNAWKTDTKRSIRSAMTTFFPWCVKTGRISLNPAMELPRFESSPANPKPVQEDDYLRVVAECEPRLRIAIRLAGELGLRRAEVAAVRREHLEHDQNGWTLTVLGKGAKTRFLPVADELARELMEHIETYGAAGYAFPSVPGYHLKCEHKPDSAVVGHISPHWIGTLVARELPDGYTMHKLRHRAATQTYRRSGNDVFLASELMGHSSIAITQRYVATDRSKLRATIAGLNEAEK